MSLFKFTLGEIVKVKSGVASNGFVFSGRELAEITRLGTTIDVEIQDKLFTFFEDELLEILPGDSQHSNAISGLAGIVNLNLSKTPWGTP